MSKFITSLDKPFTSGVGNLHDVIGDQEGLKSSWPDFGNAKINLPEKHWVKHRKNKEFSMPYKTKKEAEDMAKMFGKGYFVVSWQPTEEEYQEELLGQRQANRWRMGFGA